MAVVRVMMAVSSPTPSYGNRHICARVSTITWIRTIGGYSIGLPGVHGAPPITCPARLSVRTVVTHVRVVEAEAAQRWTGRDRRWQTPRLSRSFGANRVSVAAYAATARASAHVVRQSCVVFPHHRR